MNKPTEFDLYLHLHDPAAAPANGIDSECAARQARMAQEIDNIVEALQVEDEVTDLALTRRLLAGLPARPALAPAAKRARWLPLAFAASLMSVWLLSGWWHERTIPAGHSTRTQRADLVVAQLQGHQQLLLLASNEPDQIALQAAIARQLLQSHELLVRAAELSKDDALLRYCEQVEPVLLLLAHRQQPLPQALQSQIRDADLAFQASILSRTAISL